MSRSFIEWIFFALDRYGYNIIVGAYNTMIISIVGTFFGCVIGFLVGIVQTIPLSKNDNIIKRIFLKVVWFIVGFYVEFFRGTPMMVQAAFIFFGYSFMTGSRMDMWIAAFIIVSINTGAYMAETVRGGILSIDPGQTEGAKAIGMTHVQTMVNVLLPQALRNIMPQIGNNLIINIKDTCVLSTIGIVELMYEIKSTAGAIYAYFPVFTIAMVVYFVLTYTCSRILRIMENRMDGPASYDIAATDMLAHTSGTLNYPHKNREGETT